MSSYISDGTNYRATTISSVVDGIHDSMESLEEKIKKVQDDVCELIMFGDSSEPKRKLTPEEYLEQDYKL